MICQFCKEENETSRVTPGMSSVTLMAFTPGHYDEQGKWVQHADPNWQTTFYGCSRGHSFSVRHRDGSPNEVALISPLKVQSWTP